MQHGLCRILPYCVGLYKLVAQAGHTRRPWQRFGRKLYCRLFHRNNRRRAAAVRFAFRAFFKPRPCIHAGLRYRLLHGQTRGNNRVRARKVPPRECLPDCHVRYNGGKKLNQRRRQGYERALLRNGQAYQDNGRQDLDKRPARPQYREDKEEDARRTGRGQARLHCR